MLQRLRIFETQYNRAYKGFGLELSNVIGQLADDVDILTPAYKEVPLAVASKTIAANFVAIYILRNNTTGVNCGHILGPSRVF